MTPMRANLEGSAARSADQVGRNPNNAAMGYTGTAGGAEGGTPISSSGGASYPPTPAGAPTSLECSSPLCDEPLVDDEEKARRLCEWHMRQEDAEYDEEMYWDNLLEMEREER